MSKERKLTVDEVLGWHGEDNDIEDLAEYLCAILNGEWEVEKAYQEILDYQEEE